MGNVMRMWTTPFVVGLVQWWVRLYTTGLPPAMAGERRAEIASDTWEHQRYGTGIGHQRSETAQEIFGRFLRGIPADLSWRLQWKEDSALLSKIAVERSTGVLLLLFVAIMFGTFLSGGPSGIDAEVEHFKDDFPKLAGSMDRFSTFPTVLILSFLWSLILIGAAAALYLTFHPHGPAFATFGAFFLLAAGILFLVDTAAGHALYDLAQEWKATGGTQGDQIWTSARAVALMYELLGFVSLFLMMWGFAAFGVLVAWTAPLPRWVGGLAVLSGLLLPLGLITWTLAEDVGWGLLMVSVLLSLLWLLVGGGWLLFRGTTEARSVESEPASSP